MKKIFIFLILISTFGCLVAQQKIDKAFPYLTWVDPESGEKSSESVLFGYDASVFTPVHQRIENLPKSDPCYKSENNLDFYLVGRYKNESMTDAVNILYSPGPSWDPNFVITDKNNKVIWNFICENMCINIHGVIYTSGNVDKMFDERCKFQLQNNRVVEAKQPYLYVGIKDKLLKPVKLYSDKTGGEVIATLPVGYEVEVLLSENYDKFAENIDYPINYLVRTSFGLVGWLRLTSEDTYHLDPVIRGLGYLGD